VTGYYAVRRRSWPLAACCVAWFGLVVVIFATINGSLSAVGGVAVLVAIVGGGAQAAMLGPVPAWAARIRREQALLLLRHDPGSARELRIGRPDLPRAYDDGGLVDVNAAPERTLAALPGITPERAHRIVAYREAHGCVSGVGELVAAGLLPRRLPWAARAALVAIPPLADSRPTVNA
jgi:hypothetical protein